MSSNLWGTSKVADIIISSNTGLDAIKSAPIVNYDTGVKCIRIQDISQKKNFSKWGFCEVEKRNFEKFKLRRDDILIARTGASIGVNKIIDENMRAVFNNGLIRLRADAKKVDSRFLFYNMQSERYKSHIHSISGGTSTQPNMKMNALLDFEIMLPPLSVQRSISNILKTLDDKINLNNKINKKLEEMAQVIFKSWFVDFEPFNDEKFLEYEYGKIPKSWEIMKLKDVCIIQKGLSYKGKHLKNIGIPMINLGCVEPGGDFRINKMKFYDGEFKSNHTVSPGDIIIANTDMTSDRLILGSPIIVPELDNSTIIFTHHLFAFKDLKISREYLYYFLKSETFRKRAEGYANGTTVLSLSKEDILSIDFLVPDNQTLEKFTNIVGNIIKLKQNNDYENLKLEKIRDSLLPKLMSGEIRVPIMEISHEEVC